MRLERIIRAVYCEPWLIDARTHAAIRRLLDSKLAQSLPLPESIPASEAKGEPVPVNIAEIPIHGVIGRRLDGLEKACTGGVDLIDVEGALSAAVEDPSIAGIFLNMDSPGGTVGGVAELANYVAAAKAIKPVMAYADGMMASAAYWIGAGASVVYASSGSEVGSIGVYIPWVDESAAYAMDGLKVDLIKNKEGDFKGMGMPGTSLTTEQRANLQEAVDQIFGMFSGFVTAHRPKVKADAMRGQTFIGESARSVGLVDSITSRSRALADLVRLCNPDKKKR